jgi:catechol 2,3-dioxygenase-like lactoylglutathione lyase family enzyme
MKVLEFAFIGYPVTNLQLARAFYEEVLGLKPATVWGDEKEGWVEYEIGPHTLAVTNTSEADWKPDHGAGLALEVEDFDEAVAELKARGVPFKVDLISSPECRMAVISDPDGNWIGIHKRKAG